jgi:CheY-like chemotaxis protein/anti-sigma regulatory factor (Ser/Thr protein kinase)
MLTHGAVPPERAKRALEVVGRNARLQAQLIEDILDVSRIISGKLEIERIPVSASQLFESAIFGIAPAAEAKRIVLRQHIASNLPPIEGDPKRLHQVLNNVLSNAVKFTPEGGSIAVDCEADGTSLTIRVQDSGTGIAADFLPFVFDRFRQADSRSTRAHGGLGLGLAIARHLVEEHGGTIEAHSEGIGRGTTVIIRLPFGALGEARAVPEAAAIPADVRFETLMFLVVDDQPDAREMLAALLQHRGARVITTESAQSALNVLDQQPVDLVIADIAMPGVDGYEFMRRVRATGCRTPAIAVTAFARPDDRRTALECGYTGYLAKPIDGPLLARTIRKIVPASSQASITAG